MRLGTVGNLGDEQNFDFLFERHKVLQIMILQYVLHHKKRFRGPASTNTGIQGYRLSF